MCSPVPEPQSWEQAELPLPLVSVLTSPTGPRRRLKPLNSAHGGCPAGFPAAQAKNLDVIFASSLCLTPHIQSGRKSCWLCLHNIFQVQPLSTPLLPPHCPSSLVSPLDLDNGLLTGPCSPPFSACPPVGLRKSSHLTPPLCSEPSLCLDCSSPGRS